MIRIGFFVVVVASVSLAGLSSIALAGDPISPLYQARLDATLAGWDMAAMGAGGVGEIDPEGGPISAQPFSFCVGSLCAGSYCFGSVCVNSDCLGSACINSGCVGSGCVGSVCVASGCVGSMCGGSACLGVTLCTRACGGDGPPTPQPPLPPGRPPSYSPLNCPEQ